MRRPWIVVLTVLAVSGLVPGSARADLDETEGSDDPADFSAFFDVAVLADESVLTIGVYAGAFAGLDAGADLRTFVQRRDPDGAVDWTVDAGDLYDCGNDERELDAVGPVGRSDVDGDDVAYFTITSCTGSHVVAADAAGVRATLQVSKVVGSFDVGDGPVDCHGGFYSADVDPAGGIHVLVRDDVLGAGDGSGTELIQLDRDLAPAWTASVPGTVLRDLPDDDECFAPIRLANLVASDGRGWIVAQGLATAATSELVMVEVAADGSTVAVPRRLGLGCGLAPGDAEVEAITQTGQELWIATCDDANVDPDDDESVADRAIHVFDEATLALETTIPFPDPFFAPGRGFSPVPRVHVSQDATLLRYEGANWRLDRRADTARWDGVATTLPPTGSAGGMTAVERRGDRYVEVGAIVPPEFLDEVGIHRVYRARITETTLPAVGAIRPQRLLDTRTRVAGPLAAGVAEAVDVVDAAALPPGVAAAMVNLTAVRPAESGFVTAWPCDVPRPTTSALNYDAGRVTGNAAVVPLAGDGSICVESSTPADLVVDVSGYLRGDASVASITPARLTDTRSGEQTVDGVAAGTGRLAAGEVRRIPAAGRAGLPDDPDRVVVNLTAIRPEERGFLVAWDCADPRPATSSLNFTPGAIVGNLALVGVDASGEICVASSAATHLVVDATASLGAIGGFVDREPLRFVDTRADGVTYDGEWAAGGAYGADTVATVPFGFRGVDGPDGDRVDFRLVLVNLTAVSPAADGYFTLYSCPEDGGPAPLAATVNYAAGEVAGNTALVAVESGPGHVCVYTSASTHSVIDVVALR